MTKRINKILWHGTKVPQASSKADGLDGLNEGELFIKNDPEEPGIFIRTTDSKVVKVGDSGIKLLNRLFTAFDANGNQVAFDDFSTTIASIRANYGLWTEYFLSAKGRNPSTGSSSGGDGASTLGGLNNVADGADVGEEGYDVAKMLVLEANSNLWTLKNLSELVGLDEDALARYLLENNYAKKSDIPSLTGYATESWVLDKGYATTSDLDSRIDALVNGAPAAYDTLKEIADVLGKNVDSIADILDALGTKANKTDVDAAISAVNASISALNTELSGKIDLKLDAATFNELFEKVQLSDGTWAIRAKLGLYTDYFLSAKGVNASGGSSTGGAGALYQLADVAADGQQVSGAAKGALLMYNGTQWQGVSQSEIVPNLTGYAKLTDIPTDDINNGVTAYGWGDHSSAGYLTGITSALVTGALGYTPFDAANFTQAKIKSTLGISDWALASSKPSYTTSEVTEGANLYFTNARAISALDSIVAELQGGIDGLWARSSYDELFVNHLMADSISAETLYGSLSFDYITNKPTTISGYGITDAYTASAIDNYINTLTVNLNNEVMRAKAAEQANLNKITTLQGYFTNGVANSAARLSTTSSYTAWGQTFFANGVPQSISGALTNVTNITMSGTITTNKIVIGDGAIEWDAENNGFKVVGGLYSESYLSAKGANSSGESSGGGLVESIWKKSDLGGTFGESDNDTFNAYAINSIHSRVSVLEGKATNVTYSQTQTSGTALGVITIDGASKTIYAPTIPTSLKNPNALTFGTKTYDGSAAKEIVKGDLGLGNVENTALSTWKGTSNITTLGTITSGTWNGTKIANSYLANSAITIAGTSVTLGSSITAATLQSNLGLGTLAYKGSLSFSELTSKPTTISGYGITDAYTKNEVNTLIDSYTTALQGGIDGLWARDSFGELYAGHLMADTIAAETIYGNLGWDNLTNKPTTLGGYGITDAYISSGIVVLGSNSIKPLTAHQTIYTLTMQAGAFSAGTYTPNSAAKTIYIPTTTSHIGEGSNLYYTNARVLSAMDSYVATLQGEIDSLWARNEYSELYIGHLMGDTIAATSVMSDTMQASEGIWSDGYVSAKGQNTSSDIRLKNVLGVVDVGVGEIANAPSVRFSWKNGGGVDVGSIAQYWQNVLPDAVKERDGRLEMQYANIALLSAIALAKRVMELEKEISELKNR